ncbi:uncharacterized protein LOC114739742, partial [Neltuma alba]|uniref:uncharacterized protein LOC114739742 n=1 Tax=Neltuma alba TaxID=207710 RepID=UPI0010A3D06F
MSETDLSPISHVISRVTTPSSPKVPSSNNVTKVKLRRKTNDLDGAYDHEISSSASPYYKGLLYQPIVIDDEYISPNHDHHQNHDLNSGHSNSGVPATSGSSPYYRGLTDFSLVIHGGRHLQSHDDYGYGIHDVEAAYECNPYFRGLLTDSSLAMAIRKPDGGGGGASCGHGGVMLPFGFSMNLCLGGKDDILNDITAQMESERQRTLSSLSPPAPIPLTQPSLPLSAPPPSVIPSKGTTSLSTELKVEDGKPMGGGESEETAHEEKAVDIKNNKEEAMNESGLPNEEVIRKKKSLRESVSNISEQTASASSSSSESESSSNKDVPQEIKVEEEEEGSLKEYVWANKYQPKALQQFICHKQIVSQLLTMVKEGSSCDHFIFEGPPGVGKRTMIRALLREVFGNDVVKVTEEYRTVLLKIVEVLKYIGKEERKELPLEFLTKVVEKSKNNLRQAIRSLEATCQNKLYMIHVKLESLMIHKVSPDFVYKYLVSELKSLVDESLRPGLEKLKKEYKH